MSRNVLLKSAAALLLSAVFVAGPTPLAAAEPGAIALSLKRHAAAEASQPAPPQANVVASQARKTTSAWTKVAAGVLGGLAGFFAGGYIGAAIDGDCGGCDDPGFKGAIIGAPIGAAVGATLGVVLAAK